MKVVFLDFDGVLNSHEYMRSRAPDTERGSVMGLDRSAVKHLNDLLSATGAEVVVSSSWRHGRTLSELTALLRAAGFTGTVRGKTPDCAVKPDGTLWRGAMRGNEIQSWLSLAPLFGIEVEAFVIIDDDSDMAHLSDRHIKTTREYGLTAVEVEQARDLMMVPLSVTVPATREDVIRFVP